MNHKELWNKKYEEFCESYVPDVAAEMADEYVIEYIADKADYDYNAKKEGMWYDD